MKVKEIKKRYSSVTVSGPAMLMEIGRAFRSSYENKMASYLLEHERHNSPKTVSRIQKQRRAPMKDEQLHELLY